MQKGVKEERAESKKRREIKGAAKDWNFSFSLLCCFFFCPFCFSLFSFPAA
jgi:hypothetical protein